MIMGTLKLCTRAAALVGTSMLVPLSMPAAQDMRAGVDLSVEAEATSNPYLDMNDSEWVGAGSVEVRPWLASITATDRIDLEAFARLRGFTSVYNLEDTYGASLSIGHRADSRTSLRGSANLYSTSARSNYAQSLRDSNFITNPQPINPGEPVTELPPPLPVGPIDDPTLLGLDGRSTSLSTSAGIDRRLTERSSLSGTIGFSKVWVSDPSGTGYDSASADIAYTRSLSERTNVGATASVAKSRYEGAYPSSTTVGLLGTFWHQVDEAWRVGGSLGVNASFTPASVFFPEREQVGLAGNVSACRQDAEGELCLSYSRSQQPSALGSIRTSNTANLTYNARLGPRDSLQLYGNYSVNSTDENFGPFDDNFTAMGVGGTYSRTLSNRADAFAFATVSKTDGGFVSDEPSISVGVGLRIRLGDPR